jgi:hypothetical protein
MSLSGLQWLSDACRANISNRLPLPSVQKVVTAAPKYLWITMCSLIVVAHSAGTVTEQDPNTLTEQDLVNYLVQSVCLDELHRPTAGTPLGTGCRNKRPQDAQKLRRAPKRWWRARRASNREN